MPLSGADRHTLRALGHSLKPLIFVGKEGVSDSLLKAIDEIHETHELFKLKVLETCPASRHEVAEILEKHGQSEVVQVIGRIVLLYRKHPEKPVLLKVS